MRTWGRIPNGQGGLQWVAVSTDPTTGDSSWVYVTALCQVLLLNLGESPFYAQYGIPAQQTIIQQVQPDFYVTRVQQQFAPYFASLVVLKLGTNPPSYQVNVILKNGAKASATVAIPK